MRTYSRKGFIQTLVETVKQEYDKDTELKENIKKFRKETKELEDSETLKKVRHKFEEISRETSQNTEVIQETLGKVKTKISEVCVDNYRENKLNSVKIELKSCDALLLYVIQYD